MSTAKRPPDELMRPIDPSRVRSIETEIRRRLEIAREFLGMPEPASPPEEHRQRTAIIAAFPLALCCETGRRAHPGGKGKQSDSFFSVMNRRNKRG